MALVCSHATAQGVSDTRPAYIEVQAQAVIEAQPDTASVEFGVATRVESAAATAQRDAWRMQAVLSPVKQALGARAKAAAEAIAATLQVEVGPVLSVTHQDAGPIRPFIQEGIAVRSAPARTSIEPGTISVRAGVPLRMPVVN